MMQKFFLLIVALGFTLDGYAAAQVSDFGDPYCPCLKTLAHFPLSNTVEEREELYESLGRSFNASSYGVGCGMHDVLTPQCRPVGCSNIFPIPLDCDRSWCERSWCWVDPTNCDLLNRRSDQTLFRKAGRYYSYATCGDMDSFTKDTRVAALVGTTLKVGFVSNTGGWKGAYSSENEHFKGPMSRWTGPAVNFVKAAAYRGGFNLNLTEP
jgi:hypothetical protein